MSTELQPTKWLDFYRPYFVTEAELSNFVHLCVAQTGPTHAAKIVMHQVRRLVMLADQMVNVRPDRDSLHIFWFIVCAEAASKLQADFTRDGQSKMHVMRFFEHFASDDDKEQLAGGFTHPTSFQRMTLNEAVGTLYAVRCDVAHEGVYWDFAMALGIPMVNVTPPAIVSLTLGQLRDVIVRTGIRVAQSRLPDSLATGTQ